MLCLALGQGALFADGGDHPFHLSTSTYLGDSGDTDKVMGVRVLSDGTLAVAALIGEAQPQSRATGQPVTPVLLNGADARTPGAILQLSSEGREVLSVTRFSDDIRDLEIDSDDNLYVAAGAGGLVQLNPAADTVLAVRQAGEYVERVTTSSSHVATLVPDNIGSATSTPGPGEIIFYDRAGVTEVWRSYGLRHTMDIAIDDASQTVAHIGWRQAWAWQENGSGVLPVQISYLRGLDFSGNEKWMNYDWSSDPDIDGLPSEFDPDTGRVKITNPRFINSTGQPTGEVDDLGRPLYGYLNNMADTRGYRLTMGEDGFLYGGFEAAGGNHIFRSQGLNDLSRADFREGTSRAGGDFFNSFINTGASHKTYIARYQPGTGEYILGNQFNTLVDKNGNPSANTLRLKRGGLFVDAQSRVYFCGAAASGLPLPGNTMGSPMEGQISLEPFGVATNEGGAYAWIVGSDMVTRLFVGRTGNGSGRSIHARTPDSATSPIISWGGRAALSRPMHVFEAFQPQPGYGTDDGFLVVLGDTPSGDADDAFVFSYGGSGVDYVAESTQLRGTELTQRTDTIEGEAVTITEYAYSDTVPLSPPAPGYSGPEFFGGVRAIHRDPARTGFSGNSYSGSQTSIRIQKDETRSQAIYYFPKASMSGVDAPDTLTFTADSFLQLNGGNGGYITGGRWLVRDGDTFYVSEALTSDRLLTFVGSQDNGNWAELEMKPSDPLDFEIDESAFAPHVFTDVTAVGFVQYRPEYVDSRFTSEWNAFQAGLALNAEANAPPVPVIVSDGELLNPAPATITFDASGSFDSDGEITFIRWKSGDGADSAGEGFTHTYETAGNYTATLTVWDDQQVKREQEVSFSVASPQTPRLDRVIAAWGGRPYSSNFRFGGNDTVQLDLSGNGLADDTRRGTGYDEEIRLWNRLSLRGTPVYGGIWSSTLNGDHLFASQGPNSNGFSLRIDKSTESQPTAVHGVFLIQKEDFLAGAGEQVVSLREGDQFHMLGIDKFGGIGPLRWMVRDGNRYYVSEAILNKDYPTFTVPADNDHGRWAEWDPNAAADHLNFDADSADFATRVFSDITAYGVVIDTDTFADGRIWFTFDELVFEGRMEPNSVEMPLDLRVDFGTNEPEPGGNWNTLTAAETQSNFVHFTTGETIPVAIDMVNTGGDGIRVSGATQTWGSRNVAPDWSNPDAVSDRLWINRNHSATLRLRNLNPQSSYTLEIASSFDADGSAGSQPGLFRLEDRDGAVEGFNAHTGGNLGTDILWTSRGPNDGGDSEHSAEGWLRWSDLVPSANGSIELFLSAPNHSLARVSLNALRLVETSAGGGSGLPDPGTRADWRLTHFGSTENSGDAADMATPTGDGVPNLLKFALGLDPTIPATGTRAAPLWLALDSGSNVLELVVPANLNRPELIYQIQSSNDLLEWATEAEAVGSTSFSLKPDAGFSEPIHDGAVWQFPVTAPSPDAAFYRLSIQLID